MRHLIFFAVLGLFWGGSFLAIHFAVADFPPVFGAFLRVLVCFLCMCALSLSRPRARMLPHLKWQIICAGALNLGIPLMLLFWAEKHVSPSLGSIYNSTTTIFVALLTPLFLPGTGFIRRQLIGIALGFIGMIVVFSPNISAHELSLVYAQLALTGMAISYALGTIWVQHLIQRTEYINILLLQSFGALATLGVFTSLLEAPWNVDFATIHMSSLIAVLYLGTCSTFIAWVIFIRLINERGATQAVSIAYIVPPISILLDWAVLHRVIAANDVIGVAIILLGVWLIQKQSTAKMPKTQPLDGQFSKETAI